MGYRKNCPEDIICIKTDSLFCKYQYFITKKMTNINNQGKLSEIQYSKYAWHFTITWTSVSVYKGIEFLPQTQIFKSLQQGRMQK